MQNSNLLLTSIIQNSNLLRNFTGSSKNSQICRPNNRQHSNEDIDYKHLIHNNLGTNSFSVVLQDLNELLYIKINKTMHNKNMNTQ